MTQAVTPLDLRASRLALSADARRERLTLFALLGPGLLIVGLAVVLPIAWLFWLSVVGEDGELTLDNYSRIASNEVYFVVFRTTFLVSLTTTGACVLLGMPLAYFLCQLRRLAASLVLLAVLLPFWTSLLVRTYAWLVILGRNGVVNNSLARLGLTDAPLDLVYNFTGAAIGMTHIMLPVFVLPAYAAMRQVEADLLRAAASLGASATRVLWTVFLPLAWPGIAAGAILVFVFSLGFYVTPAILGGGKVNMISMRIERSVSTFHNWGAASALGVVLLLMVSGLFVAGYALPRLILRWRGTVSHA